MGRPPSKTTEIVKFDGKTYYRPRGKKYFKTYDDSPGGEYLHRDVWRFHYGAIPEGHAIHHKDNNSTNNRIDNLEALTIREHGKRHADSSPERRAFLDSIRDKGKEWQNTEAAKRHHREFGRKCLTKYWKQAEYKSYVCDRCGESFLSRCNRIPRFCSETCRERSRKKKKHGHQCVQCGKDFVSTGRDTKNCSKKCAALYWRACVRSNRKRRA